MPADAAPPADPDADRLFKAAVLGDDAGAAAVLERRPDLLTAKIGPRSWEPLLYVCFGKQGAGDAERAAVARRLLALGADPNTSFVDLPHWPNSPQAALYGATGENDYPQLARVLLEAGADPNDCESRYHAAEHHHLACLELLKSFGTDFSGRDKTWGNTPLYFLFGYRHPSERTVQGISWILDQGADVNVPSGKLRETPLSRAITNFWPMEMIQRLIAAGADVNAKRADGVTLYAAAIQSGRPNVAGLLAHHGAEATATPKDKFLGACLGGEVEAAHRALEKNPKLRDAAIESQVAFTAAREDRAPALTLLHELGIDLNGVDEGGATPLHWAAWHGRAEAVAALIRLGAAINVREKTYQAPPLGWCDHGWRYCGNRQGNYAGVAQHLIGAGAEIPAGFDPGPELQALLSALQPPQDGRA